MTAVKTIPESNGEDVKVLGEDSIPYSDPVHSPKESDYLNGRASLDSKKSDNGVFIIGMAGGSASGKTSVSE
jgi:hypothetical protein